MEIEEIQQEISGQQYEISFHAEKERYAEGISIADLENAVSNGSVIEKYPDDPRGQSYLVLGYSSNRAIHIVCGRTSIGLLRIITVYIPKLPKWVDEKTRAKGDRKNA